MIENNIIQNLGLEKIPQYQLGGLFDPILWILNRMVKTQSDRKRDVYNVQSKKNKKKTTKTASNDNSSNTHVTQNVTQSSPAVSSTGNMDWMSEYGSPTTETTQQEEVEEREPFNAVEKVWNDEVLSKVDTAVASRYLKNNLQDLLNLYNIKVAETIGQKRS